MKNLLNILMLNGQIFKKNNLLDYSYVSPSYLTNNLLENYNGRIKKILGINI